MTVLEQEQLERLENAIKKTDETEKDYHIMRVRKKIERYIEDLEDLALARERLLDKSETIPFEEVLKKRVSEV